MVQKLPPILLIRYPILFPYFRLVMTTCDTRLQITSLNSATRLFFPSLYDIRTLVRAWPPGLPLTHVHRFSVICDVIFSSVSFNSYVIEPYQNRKVHLNLGYDICSLLDDPCCQGPHQCAVTSHPRAPTSYTATYILVKGLITHLISSFLRVTSQWHA